MEITFQKKLKILMKINTYKLLNWHQNDEFDTMEKRTDVIKKEKNNSTKTINVKVLENLIYDYIKIVRILYEHKMRKY